MQHGIVQGLIRKVKFLYTKAELTLITVVVCSNWNYSEREERTFFELLLFCKVTLRMFWAVSLFMFGIFGTCLYPCRCALGLIVHLAWSASFLLFSHIRRYFLLHECHAYISYKLITWAATRYTQPHKPELSTRRNTQPLHKPGVEALCWDSRVSVTL